MRRAALLSGLAAMVGMILLSAFVFLVYRGTFGDIPTYADLRNIRNANASEIYSDDDRLLGKYYVENRVSATSDEIPPVVVNALIATEDARFFEHEGVDLRAFLRVMVKSILLFDDSSGGGSTLSQQLAKNLFPREDHGLLTIPAAKIKEMVTARRLEKLYSKEELLNLYLNTVPYGENVYGIKVAARRFFNKAPRQLRVEEAAVLVGLLKANTYYNPVRNPEHATRRRNIVLAQMARYGYLTDTEKDSLQQLALTTDYQPDGRHRGLAVYFREHLRREVQTHLQDLKKPNGSPYNLDADGLKIYTSLDSRMQLYAERAMREHMAELQDELVLDWKGTQRQPWGNDEVLWNAVQDSERYQTLKSQGLSGEAIKAVFETPVTMTVFDSKEEQVTRKMSPLDSVRHYLATLNTGMLAIDPRSGLVRAWVGGVDYQYFQYDHVKSRRQVGSTFKPVVYAAALQEGMLPCEYTPNQLVKYAEYQDWEPHNSDEQYGGVYSMEGAITHSVNTVSAAIIDRIGTGRVVELAHNMGIEGNVPNVPAIALGTVEASLWEMVQVYGTMANAGRRPELHFLDRIETAEGNVLFQAERPDARDFPQVLDEEVAGMMVHMLESVVDSGTARRLRFRYGLSNELAGKTGTTQSHTDGWFMGITPHLVAGVWVGADNPGVHFRTLSRGQGANTALPIFGKFMQYLNQDKAFASLRQARFPSLPDSLAGMMGCPPYLEEMPLLARYGDEYRDMPIIINRLLEELAKETGIDVDIRLRRKRRNETDREYFERMREYNERRMERRRDDGEDRKQAKDRWAKWLFGKKN